MSVLIEHTNTHTHTHTHTVHTFLYKHEERKKHTPNDKIKYKNAS